MNLAECKNILIGWDFKYRDRSCATCVVSIIDSRAIKFNHALSAVTVRTRVIDYRAIGNSAYCNIEYLGFWKDADGPCAYR
jgi:hypothetical protein